MDSDGTNQSYFIETYFEALQLRIAFLPELYATGRECEALMLCCCYIEAIGCRESTNPGSKAKNYCAILSEAGGSETWRLIHPRQLKDVLSTNGLFKEQFSTLEPLIDCFGSQLIDPQELLARLDSSLDEKQRSWIQKNIFKGSMAMISYERIRCELVHDIEADSSISFGKTTYKGNAVPPLDFDAHYSSLKMVVAASQTKAVSTNKFWNER